MDCNEIKNELYFYVQNELDSSKRAEIEGHVAACPSCRELLGEFSKTLKVADKNVCIIPRKNWDLFAEKILEKIYLPRRISFLKPAIAFALSMFVLVLGYNYYMPRHLQNGGNGSENIQESVMLPETEELVAYLTDFDVPELYQ